MRRRALALAAAAVAALTIGAITTYAAASDSTDEPAQTCSTATPREGGWTCYAPISPDEDRSR